MTKADAVPSVTLRPEENGLLVIGEEIAKDRAAFLYLRASLGACISRWGMACPPATPQGDMAHHAGS